MHFARIQQAEKKLPNKSRVLRRKNKTLANFIRSQTHPIRIAFVRHSQNPYHRMTLKRFSFTTWVAVVVSRTVQMKSRKLAQKKKKLEGAPAHRTTNSNFPMCNVGFSLIFVLFLVDITVHLSSRSPFRLFTTRIWMAKWYTSFFVRSFARLSFRFNIKRHEMCHKCNKYYLVEWACKLTYFFLHRLTCWWLHDILCMPAEWLHRVRIDTSHTFQMAAGECK